MATTKKLTFPAEEVREHALRRLRSASWHLVAGIPLAFVCPLGVLLIWYAVMTRRRARSALDHEGALEVVIALGRVTAARAGAAPHVEGADCHRAYAYAHEGFVQLELTPDALELPAPGAAGAALPRALAEQGIVVEEHRSLARHAGRLAVPLLWVLPLALGVVMLPALLEVALLGGLMALGPDVASRVILVLALVAVLGLPAWLVRVGWRRFGQQSAADPGTGRVEDGG